MKTVRRLIIAVTAVGLLTIISIGFIIINRLDLAEYDNVTRQEIVLLNDLCNQAADYYDSGAGQFSDEISQVGIDCGNYSFCILDMRKDYVYSNNANNVTGINEALKEHALVGDIVVEEHVVGKVILQSDIQQLMREYRLKIFMITSIYVTVVIILCVLILIYVINRIVIPFNRIKAFSSQVARGNLDVELPKERGGVFGSFTESFDMMREELKLSKRKEEEIARNNKEMLVSLNHDIKAPISAIKAITELLMFKVQKDKTSKEEIGRKLLEIDEKANQTTLLVHNILSVTMEDEEKFKPDIKYYYTDRIVGVIKESDYKGYIERIDIPECMVKVDVSSFKRVVDNCISNSYKYSDTKIVVDGFITNDGFLCINIKDFGTSFNSEETEYLGVKYYRGSNASEKEGNGLGLYICCDIMKKCGGFMSFEQKNDGFTAGIYLPM